MSKDIINTNQSIRPLWFNDYKNWVRYINKYMMNADRLEGIGGIVIKDENDRTIASWPKNGGSGVIYEQRSQERLEEDIDKLK